MKVNELVGCAILAGIGAALACSQITGSSASSIAANTYSPLTSIEVDANQLFAQLGCGHGAGVPFKYVVEVGQGQLDLPIVAVGTSDCFTDAVFQNIGAGLGAGGTNELELIVDVFDDVTYDANAALLSNPTVIGCQVNDAGGVPDSGAFCCRPIDIIANWQTTCTVRELPNIQALAACGPLVATGNPKPDDGGSTCP